MGGTFTKTICWLHAATLPSQILHKLYIHSCTGAEKWSSLKCSWFCALGKAYVHSVPVMHQMFGLLVWVPCHSDWAVLGALEAGEKIQLCARSDIGRIVGYNLSWFFDKESLSLNSTPPPPTPPQSPPPTCKMLMKYWNVACLGRFFLFHRNKFMYPKIQFLSS